MIAVDNIRKILIIKLRTIGDVLLSTVVLRNLRHYFPAAEIHFLTEPPSREILEGNPLVNKVIVFDRSTVRTVSFLRYLRKEQYDLVIDLFGNPRTAVMTYSTGARYRVGYSFRGRRYAYNILVEGRGGSVHNTEFNLDSLRALGFEIVDRDISLEISGEEEEYVDNFLRSNGLEGEMLIALNASGGWYTKRWGISKFARLGDILTATYKARILLLWGPGERRDAERIRELMRKPPIIPPPTTLKQLIALLKRCTLVVSNDSGPMHIAAVVGVPTLGVFGPTNPYLQGPTGEKSSWVRLEGLDCLGCNLTVCPIGHICMERLSVETVMQTAVRLMAKNLIMVTL